MVTASGLEEENGKGGISTPLRGGYREWAVFRFPSCWILYAVWPIN